MPGRPVEGRSVAVRPTGPLVARPDLGAVPRKRPPVRREPGRLGRFVQRYGWRAYAIPLLTVATVLTLGDLAFSVPTTASGAAAPSTAVAAPPAAPDVLSTSLDSDAAPTETASAMSEADFVQQGAGTVSVVDGTSPVYGAGPLRRFVVETEDGIEVDATAFAHAVETTLADPRSWGHGGRMSFQRVGAAQAAAKQYDFKVTLVSPGSMETYCPGVGTGGYTSCRYADRAVINLARWTTAVPDYQGDIPTYRLYVVNHEVGHALGHHHEFCSGPGGIAPVMQQQTLGLKGCVKNAWPYP